MSSNSDPEQEKTLVSSKTVNFDISTYRIINDTDIVDPESVIRIPTWRVRSIDAKPVDLIDTINDLVNPENEVDQINGNLLKGGDLVLMVNAYHPAIESIFEPGDQAIGGVQIDYRKSANFQGYQITISFSSEEHISQILSWVSWLNRIIPSGHNKSIRAFKWNQERKAHEEYDLKID
jgi:hypothetical protein